MSERVLVRAFLRVRRSVCARACACAHVSVHACVRVRVRVCFAVPSASIFARECVCVRVGRTTVCVRLGGAVARRGPAVLMARPAAPGGGARCGDSVRPAGCRARSAAGITWTSRTAKAGWAARYSHTSVIDAASGAIYVIGGFGGTGFNDVWVSTDGGARAGLGRSGVHWVGTHGTTRGYCRGY